MKLESLLILDDCQVLLPGIYVRICQHLICVMPSGPPGALLCRHYAFVRPAQMAAYISSKHRRWEPGLSEIAFWFSPGFFRFPLW
jgi:hypothetical protein